VAYFRRESRPPARAFYARELGKLGRPNGKGWAMARCPFHKSESGRSFSINVDSGGFHCFGCDAKGGDVISFLMLLEGYDFKTACKVLGCWDEDGSPRRRGQILERYLVWDYCIDGVQYRAEVRDEPRNYTDKIRRFYHEASDRLMELSHGDSEEYPGESETCWERMSLGLDELRELENL